MKRILIAVTITLIGYLVYAGVFHYFKSKIFISVTPSETGAHHVLKASLEAIDTVSLERSGYQEPEGGIHFMFIDVIRGYAIIPEKIIIQKVNSANPAQIVLSNEVSMSGEITIPLPLGIYDVTVLAEGFTELSSRFRINGEVLDVNFHLEPIIEVAELSGDYIRELHSPTDMVFVGFIVSDLTGRPIGDVTVTSGDGKASSKSAPNGFFQLMIPLPRTEAEIEQRNLIRFEKNGYQTEIRNRFDSWPNGDCIMRIRMKSGSGQNIESVITAREPIVVYPD